MTVGSLLQYKEKCYGRFHPRLPKIPFEKHQFLPSTHRNAFDAYPLIRAGIPVSEIDTTRKKFVLFCAQVVRVVHPKIPDVGCNYFKCFISDPYANSETVDGWVREEWIEPLNEFSTYKEEHLKQIQETFLGMVKTKKPTAKELKEFHRWTQSISLKRNGWPDS